MTDILLVAIILLGLSVLGSSRVAGCIRIVAAQGILLGALVVVARPGQLTPNVIALSALTIGVKGVVIPWLLFRSMRAAGIQREVEPFLGYTRSVVVGAIGVAVAFSFSGALPLAGVPGSALVVPASLACLFTGLLLLVTRRKAVTQVIGYLVMENGIFVFGMALGAEMPWLVEMGVLLDVFVGVFVMGIIIYHIGREFDHIDSGKLDRLHDLKHGRGLVPVKNGQAK